MGSRNDSHFPGSSTPHRAGNSDEPATGSMRGGNSHYSPPRVSSDAHQAADQYAGYPDLTGRQFNGSTEEELRQNLAGLNRSNGKSPATGPRRPSTTGPFDNTNKEDGGLNPDRDNPAQGNNANAGAGANMHDNTDTNGRAANNDLPADPTPSDQISIRVLDNAGGETHFRVRRTTRLEKIFKAYASKEGKDPSTLRFLLDGERLLGDWTPGDRDMEDGDSIEVMIEQLGGSIHLSAAMKPDHMTRATSTGRRDVSFCHSIKRETLEFHSHYRLHNGSSAFFNISSKGDST